MDHTNSAEPSLRSVAAEDYVHVSDSDFREAAPSSDLHADPDLPRSVVGAFAPSFSENDAASSQVDENKVFECLEDRRIGNSSGGGSEERRILPAELAMCVMHLECESSAEGGHCHVYLVGTAHVSQESCSEVQAVISSLKPEVVFLELCSSRIAILTPQNLKVPSINEMIDMWKKKKSNTFGILYSWFLAKVADRLDVFPGAEFRVAYEETVSYGGRVVLGDRPVNITLRRTWGKMSIWHRAKFLYYIFFQTFFLPTPEDLRKMLKDMDDVDMLTLVIQEMSKAFPTIMDTVLHERDMYMSSTLLKVASEHSLVVAVVGKGHLPGIKKYWKQPIDLKHLLQIPRRPAMSKAKFIISGIAVVGASAACSTYLIGKWAAHSQGSFLKSLVDKAPYEVQISLTIATRLESEVTKGLFGEEISPLGDGTVWSQPLVCLAVRRPGGRDPPCSLRTAEARGYQPCSRNKSGRVAQIILRAGLPLRQMSPKPNDIRFSN